MLICLTARTYVRTLIAADSTRTAKSRLILELLIGIPDYNTFSTNSVHLIMIEHEINDEFLTTLSSSHSFWQTSLGILRTTYRLAVHSADTTWAPKVVRANGNDVLYCTAITTSFMVGTTCSFLALRGVTWHGCLWDHVCRIGMWYEMEKLCISRSRKICSGECSTMTWKVYSERTKSLVLYSDRQ